MPQTAGQSRSGSRAEIADPAATRKPSVSVTVDRAAEHGRRAAGTDRVGTPAGARGRPRERAQRRVPVRIGARARTWAVLAPRGAVRGRSDRRRPTARVPGDDRPLGRIEPRRGRRSWSRDLPSRHPAVGAALDGGVARSHRRARPDRRRLRPREPARDRGHRRHDCDRARDPRRLGRPAGSGSVPGAVGRDHAVCRDPARCRPHDRGRGRERRRDHARDRGRDRPDCARLAAASARPARPWRRRALAAPPPRDDPERGRRGRADGAHRAGDDGPARREARVPERPGGRLRGRVRGRARAAADPDRRHDRALPARRDAARPAARADASARGPARGRRHGGSRDDDPVDPGRASDRRHLRVEVRGRRLMARAAQRGDVAVRARDRLPVPLSLARPLALRPRPRRRYWPCSSRSSPPCTEARAS